MARKAVETQDKKNKNAKAKAAISKDKKQHGSYKKQDRNKDRNDRKHYRKQANAELQIQNPTKNSCKDIAKSKPIECSYDLEINRIIAEIQKSKAKKVCIQLPDGLKMFAGILQQEIEKSCDCYLIFWAGSNFGACDLPLGLENSGIELLIHVGHAKWR